MISVVIIGCLIHSMISPVISFTGCLYFGLLDVVGSGGATLVVQYLFIQFIIYFLCFLSYVLLLLYLHCYLYEDNWVVQYLYILLFIYLLCYLFIHSLTYFYYVLPGCIVFWLVMLLVRWTHFGCWIFIHSSNDVFILYLSIYTLF